MSETKRISHKVVIFNVSGVIFFALFFVLSRSVEGRHLKLYGMQIPDEGVTWVTYTNDFIPSLSIPTSTGDVGNVILHEIEIETGINRHWSQSVYFDFDTQYESPDSDDNNSRLAQIKTEFNIRVFESKLFDFRINNEWAFNTGNYTDPLAQEEYSNSIELRPIFSKSVDAFTFIIGPGFFYRYTEEPKELTYFYANAIQYALSNKTKVGLEFHGDLGDKITASKQSHYIVPDIDIKLHEKVILSVGIGFGLNEQSEKYTFRNALQFNYKW